MTQIINLLSAVSPLIAVTACISSCSVLSFLYFAKRILLIRIAHFAICQKKTRRKIFDIAPSMVELAPTKIIPTYKEEVNINILETEDNTSYK